MKKLVPVLLYACLSIHPVMANGQSGIPNITSADRKDVVDVLAKTVRAQYIFPDVAEQVAAAIQKKELNREYESGASVVAFGRMLNQDLRTHGKDLHFEMFFDPKTTLAPGTAEDQKNLAPDRLKALRDEAARDGFGVAKVERLPGNVGYIDLRTFYSAELSGSKYSSALSLLAGTDAMIIDLRKSPGGDPASVSNFLSHFFQFGDTRHLVNIEQRAGGETRQYWTDPAISERYLKPVYVLTSAKTASGAEECAYDFQVQKRGTVVGETTSGAANPGKMFSLGHGYLAFISTGRAINPVTRTNWEKVGVKPDVAVPALQAQRTAYISILRTLAENEPSQRRKNDLLQIIASEEAEAAKEKKTAYAP